MAENSEPSSGEQAPAALMITKEALMGQSKCSAEEFVLFKDLPEPVEGTNKLILVCLNCKCKVMRPGYGSFTVSEVGHERLLINFYFILIVAISTMDHLISV